jgi:carboxypeptidase C (cathepsin A)
MPYRTPAPVRSAFLALAALALLAFPAGAQDPPKPPQSASPPAPSHRAPPPADVVTQHEIVLGGHTLAYSATAGTLTLTDGHGETTADIFYVAFMLTNPADAEHRPISYVFNGGPGASSAYLDIAAIGPRAIAAGHDGSVPAVNEHVVDNPDTWLPFTDLVFIDPVGAGYSRATGSEDAAAKEFWGVNQDLDALGDIIRLHLTRTGRLTAPVYLVGESYGGFRAARLAHDLDVGRGIRPSGVVMISPVIDFGLMTEDPMDPLPWALRLPSYAAAALGEKSIAPGALDDVESYALHDYLLALAAGPGEGAAAQSLYQRLAHLTGLDIETVARLHGMIPIEDFLSNAHLGDGRVASRYDATVTATDPNPWDIGVHDDPVLDATVGPISSAFVGYVRDELGFKTDQPFELLNRVVGRRWDWRGGRDSFHSLDASSALRRALSLEPKLKVLIAHGVSDVQTPYMMSRYVKSHMPTALGERIALKLYAGGHMLYLRSDSRTHLHDDVAEFYGAAEN